MNQREHMEAKVQCWRESGLKKKEFCQQQGIKESVFSYWITRINQNKPKGFVPLIELSHAQASAVEVIYPNGVRIKVATIDLKAISQLVRLY
ncbi:MAG: IS66 family insertion sequence element accessory protein TnpA [Daejeonella sp.]